jgi:hypothetical protein
MYNTCPADSKVIHTQTSSLALFSGYIFSTLFLPSFASFSLQTAPNSVFLFFSILFWLVGASRYIQGRSIFQVTSFRFFLFSLAICSIRTAVGRKKMKLGHRGLRRYPFCISPPSRDHGGPSSYLMVLNSKVLILVYYTVFCFFSLAHISALDLVSKPA